MERLIELLKDGKWHSLEEIAEKPRQAQKNWRNY